MSSYTSFIKSTTISADEMNNNFNYIGAGHWIPMSGATLTTDTTETLDIGSQFNRWDTLYVNNLNLDGEISQSFNLIAEVTLNDTSSSIEFDNLNGDQDEVYILRTKIVSDGSGDSDLQMALNNDSSSNYGYQFLQGIDGAVSAARSSRAYMLVATAETSISTTTKNSYSEMILYAKTGNERLSLSQVLRSGGGTYIYGHSIWGQVWNDTSNTITSIKLSFPGGKLTTNTNIQLWAKVSTITARDITITTA
jgi:hypothetical protein